MNPKLEIFSQGEEVVTGQTVDTNAAWLSQQAVAMGFEVARHTAVGDNLADLKALLKEISERADCCICTGGLGPTIDDLTAQAVAEAFSLPLALDVQALAQIGQFFRHRQKAMPDSNRKQALLPQGSQRLDNHWGTAPGFTLAFGRCWFVFLPGVPHEMRQLFEHSVQPTLLERFQLTPKLLVTLKTIGLGESDLQQRISAIALPENVQLGFCAREDEVQTKLLFPHGYPAEARQQLIARIAGQLGYFVYGIDDAEQKSGSLAGSLATLMQAHNARLSVIETLSHGLLAAKCVNSDWLDAVYIQPSLERLAQAFAVALNPADLADAAHQLALAMQAQNPANWVLVQLCDLQQLKFTQQEQPVVLYNALLAAEDLRTSQHTLAGSLARKQNQAAMLTLDLLRRYLQHHPI